MMTIKFDFDVLRKIDLKYKLGVENVWNINVGILLALKEKVKTLCRVC